MNQTHPRRRSLQQRKVDQDWMRSRCIDPRHQRRWPRLQTVAHPSFDVLRNHALHQLTIHLKPRITHHHCLLCKQSRSSRQECRRRPKKSSVQHLHHNQRQSMSLLLVKWKAPCLVASYQLRPCERRLASSRRQSATDCVVLMKPQRSPTYPSYWNCIRSF